MNAKLKSFASNLMLITGIITSIAGVIETIGKLVLSFRTKNIPEVKSISKSIIPEYGDLPSAPPTIEQVSFFAEYRGIILIVTGILVIAFSLWIIKRLKTRI